MTNDQEKQNKPVRRKFYWMPRLDFYVFREFLIPFSVLIFAFTLLFMIGDVFNDIDQFLEQNASAWTTTRYFLLKIPGNIRFILPITVLLSCMYTLANFGRHREITAMRASGISLCRCAFPIYVIAFCVMLVNFWFNETLVASCSQEARSIMLSLDRQKGKKIKAQQDGGSLQFVTADGKRHWVFGQFNSKGMQYHVRVKFFTNGNEDYKAKRIVDAVRVEYKEDTGWIFYDCLEEIYAENGFAQVMTHEKMVLTPEDAPETPELVLTMNTPAENLSAREIYFILKNNPNFVPQIRDYYMTYFYRHLAFPWACFLCAFLALPLAAKNERSGIFLAIAIAVAVIIVYQVVSEIMLLLGKNGTLPPFVAGVLPTAVFATYGIILARKSG